MLEDEEKTGRLFEITVIAAGVSKNGRDYSPEVLRASAEQFENLNVFIHKFDPDGFDDDADHLPDVIRGSFPDGVAGNLIGFLENVRVIERDGKTQMIADLHVVDENMRAIFKNLYEARKLNKLGFSIDVEGTVIPGPSIRGVSTQIVQSIDKVNQLDVVTHPAAGGKLNRMLASEKKLKETEIMNKKMLEFIKAFAPSLLKGKELAKLTEAELSKIVTEAIKALEKGLKAKPLAESNIQEKLDEMLKKALAFMAEGKISEAMEQIKMAMESLGANASVYAPPGEKTEAEIAQEAADKKEAEEKASAKEAAEAKLAEQAAAKKKTAEEKATAEASAKESSTANKKEIDGLKDTVKDLKKNSEERAVRESAANLRAKLAESKLPMPMREAIAKEYKGKVVEEKDMDTRISESKDMLAKLSESGEIKNMGEGGSTSAIHESTADKLALAIDLLLDPGVKNLKESEGKYKDVKEFRGLREAYEYITGDRHVRFDGRRTKSMLESTTASFPKIFGDSITRHLLRNYQGFPQNWRKAVTIISVNDFRAQLPIRWGTFDDLAIVAESGVFTALNNPSEVETSYTPAKRGKSFFITREMILQDDLRKLRNIGPMMARTANRTLEKFVWNLVIGNAGGGGINSDLVSDGTAIYTVGHSNLGTAALDADSLRAALIRLMLQQDEDSNETLGLTNPWLYVPIELKPTADVLVNSELKPGSANNDINDNFEAAEVVAIPYLGGDPNNFYLQAKQADLESIELGFVEGAEEPTVLIQDDPLTGEVFTNERITYKVRHEYGGAVVAFQGLDGNIVP